ncbi:hypothetical protein D9Q98_002950 [Chlorella vulgaris]|uniref:Uncharacterized protein n=1 Tax=Chlorella vulgaris TaxID=3077 RepID=A0A9D4TUI8_CHLVU|nr:hypothetical protein D9Q98_002950 [Chlorella vulgaris]
MFRAALSALWPLDQPEHPRTPDSNSRSGVFDAEADAHLAAAHAQVAAMSADERRQLAAAGRARVVFPERFASWEAERAYLQQRLLELAAKIQVNAENKQHAAASARQARSDQPFSADTKDQAPQLPSAARPAAEANAEQRIPAAWATTRTQQAKLSVKGPEDLSAAAGRRCEGQVLTRPSEEAAKNASRAHAREAVERDQHHRQQQRPVAVAAWARQFYPVPAEKKTQ